MNSKLFTLTKVMMKGGTGVDIRIGKGKYSKIIGLAILAAAFIPIAVYLGLLTSGAYDLLSAIDQAGIILSLGVSISTLLIFFFGIFFVLSIYYFVRDVENLLPMPLKPYEIIGAKFIVIVIYEYLTELLTLGPIILVYGIKSGAGPAYYIYSLIVFLLLPVIPIAIGSLIVMVVMAFTSIGVNRDRLNLIGGIIILALAVGMNFWMQRFSLRWMDPEKIMDMFQQGGNSLVKITSGIFPGTSHAAVAMAGSSELKGLLSILTFCAIVAAATGIFLYAGQRLYFRGVIGISELKSKREKISSRRLDRAIRRNSRIKTYIMKELRILMRTPVYFLNCVAINFLWPVFLILPFLANPGGMEGFNEIASLVQNINKSLLLAIGVGVILFTASSNGIASTAISREGRNIFVTKYLPISYINQVLAKALTAVLVSLSGTVVVMAALIIVLQMPPVLMLLVFIAGIPGILVVSFTGILLDLLNPKLHWDAEHKAVKQNMNVVFSMLIGIAFAGLLVFIIHALNASLVFAFLILTGILAVASFGLFTLLRTKGVELFEKLDA